MLPEVEQWIEYAEKDFQVAIYLYESFHPTPLEIVCYHCQQCAEKAIKAVYMFLELPGGIPKKHDLSFLLSQMRNQVDISDELYDNADDLNAYGIIARYPNELRIDDGKTRTALKYAKRILNWANEILKIEKE